MSEVWRGAYVWEGFASKGGGGLLLEFYGIHCMYVCNSLGLTLEGMVRLLANRA